MNSEQFNGEWKQIKGKIRKTWGNITDDEIEKTKGDFDMLAGKIQEKYGLKKAEAKNKVNELLKDFKNSGAKND